MQKALFETINTASAWLIKGGLSSALLFSLSACSHAHFNKKCKFSVPYRAEITNIDSTYNPRVPPYAAYPIARFNREDVVAIAQREWRLFGQPIVDIDPKQTREVDNFPSKSKPERQAGLWQRIGEYWWIGQPLEAKESYWTGLSADNGKIFPAKNDGEKAWSAAFISYVMRVAGAGNHFVYAANHSTYINAAISQSPHGLKGKNPSNYAPKKGDILCTGRGKSRNIQFNDLPSKEFFPAHCGIVTSAPHFGTPFGWEIDTIGGNVEDQVALTHVPVNKKGHVSSKNGNSLDPRFPWCAILAPQYQQAKDTIQKKG
ncbi:DUF2272 domain-containing protein [Acetobacteraceae bacterium]|nr:DUF2272 domain-containing protein [Acetobacteraceae bacterium]